MLAEKIGKTDNWLAALNFSSSVPAGLNPLSVLPIKIPLNVFFDIGTYAEPWKKDAQSDRFLYDAGLHFPLFKGAVNIYLPIIYSNEYKDYIKSTITKNKLLKTLSFSFKLDLLTREINRELQF